RGDITQSSFAFTVKDDTWEEIDSGYLRTIKEVDQLYDVSPVTYPAYPDADAGLRSLDEFKKSLETAKDKEEEKRLSDLAFKRAQIRVKELA
ncbi:MAG: HK97 family phage prohead protease, partial [Hyphomicrobiales bacterium]|nr:HK97 family phage prohead protease [Hyphomicrobiales bacterium]